MNVCMNVMLCICNIWFGQDYLSIYLYLTTWCNERIIKVVTLFIKLALYQSDLQSSAAACIQEGQIDDSPPMRTQPYFHVRKEGMYVRIRRRGKISLITLLARACPRA